MADLFPTIQQFAHILGNDVGDMTKAQRFDGDRTHGGETHDRIGAFLLDKRRQADEKALKRAKSIIRERVRGDKKALTAVVNTLSRACNRGGTIQLGDNASVCVECGADEVLSNSTHCAKCASKGVKE